MIGVNLDTKLAAQWWPDGAHFAMDFANHRFMRNGVHVAPQQAFQFERASTKFVPDNVGNWQNLAPDVFGKNKSGITRGRID
jgi:hypothetical protein